MPENSAFKQQRLPAWQPLLTPKWIIGTFFSVGVVFIIIGAVIASASNGVVQVSYRYDLDANCQLPFSTPQPGTNKTCNISFSIPSNMNPPIYFYYQLSNFYQNHRRYVKSRSDSQLEGSITDTTNCDPLTTNTNNNLPLYPCGLIANSFFNDVFDASYSSSSGSGSLFLDKSNIAWSSDVSNKFKAPSPYPSSGVSTLTSDNRTLPQVTNKDFIVWMRTAGLPNFKKLYGQISTPLPAGSVVTVNIVNQFPVSSFNGAKYVVLSTTSWLGGKNDFLGYAYLAVGIVSIILAFIFLAIHIKKPRTPGDQHFFTWSTTPKPQQ